MRFLPRSRLVDQTKWLGDRLGMTRVFQRNFSSGAGGLGNAVLSSLSVSSVYSHPLTSLDEPRGLLEVHLETPAGLLTTFCTHLGLDAEERVVQAGEIAAIVGAAQGVRVLCGDFNEAISGSAVSALVAATGLLDAIPDGSPTYPADAPAERIDFVLCDPLIGVVGAEVVETTASDHLPVTVEIQVPSAAA